VPDHGDLRPWRFAVCTGAGRDRFAAALVAGHGPFTWGESAGAAAYMAAILEELAAMALQTLAINPAPSPSPKRCATSTTSASTGRRRTTGRSSAGGLRRRCFSMRAKTPGGKTAAFCRKLSATGKRVYTIDDPANEHLISVGATLMEPNYFSTSNTVKSAANENAKG